MRTSEDFSHNPAARIVVLWTVFLLGTLFHTQLALMPLFHGLNVTESHADEFLSPDGMFWFMLAFFLLPLVAMLGIIFKPGRRDRFYHFLLTLVYTGLNLAHFLADVAVQAPPYQLVLMAFLFGVGVLLNVVAYQWLRTVPRQLPRTPEPN